MDICITKLFHRASKGVYLNLKNIQDHCAIKLTLNFNSERIRLIIMNHRNYLRQKAGHSHDPLKKVGNDIKLLLYLAQFEILMP